LLAASPHPAKAVLASRRVSVRGVARELGFSEWHVSRVLNGAVPASPRFRAALCELLSMREEELFYVQPRTRRPRYPGDLLLQQSPSHDRPARDLARGARPERSDTT